MSEVNSVGQSIEEMIAASSAENSSRNVNNELGKDDFLKLLITQLQYQDPLEPMKDTDFIAQIAQFSSLEQMQNLNNSFSYSMGFSLIGKYISATITDEDTGKAKLVEGEVSAVRSYSGNVYLVVNGEDVPIDKISNVSEKPSGYAGMDIEKYSGLIGMLGTVKTLVGGDSPYTMEGIIANIEKDQGGMAATLDEIILSVTDIEKDAFNSIDEYLEGMKGRKVTFRARDAETGEMIEITGILRDGVKDEERDCYHVILDNVKVPVDDIMSTRKVDLVSTEQQLLNEILNLMKRLDEKIPGLTEENDTGEEDGTAETGEVGEGDEPGSAEADTHDEAGAVQAGGDAG